MQLDDHDLLTISETCQINRRPSRRSCGRGLAIGMTTKSDIYSATYKGRYDSRGVDRSVLSFLILNLTMVLNE